MQEYINKDEGTKYVPMQFVLDTNKYKPDNEHHMKLLKYKMKYLDITSKNYQKLMWECVLLNGGEEIPFDESQLTDEQKEQIELGIRKLDDFRPRGQIVGNKITEYRLFDPVLTGAYSEGLVDTGMTAKEFEEEVYQPPKEEDFADMMNTPEEEKSSADTVSEDELDDLELF